MEASVLEKRGLVSQTWILVYVSAIGRCEEPWLRVSPAGLTLGGLPKCPIFAQCLPRSLATSNNCLDNYLFSILIQCAFS